MCREGAGSAALRGGQILCGMGKLIPYKSYAPSQFIL